MPTKKKKGHHPAHQNTFAFQHNPGSKLTAKILASPNVGLCRRCHDKIEWRKQYRKYKPLSQPATCNLCKRRNITAAYHTICDGCALSDSARRRMNASNASSTTDANTNADDDANTNPDVKVCAMCTKEPARREEEDGDAVIETQIQEQIHAMEIKLKRPLKLRESKGIERKVYRAHEKMKEEAKAERRRLRDEAAEAKKMGSAGVSPVLVDDEENEEDEEGQEDQEEEQSQGEKDSGNSNVAIGDGDEDEDDSDYDPFLQAVGGKDKLLTGEAYQQMMLEKGRLEQNTN